MHLMHCVLGGSESESTEEARCQKATDVATGYVTAEEVSCCDAYKHSAVCKFL